MVSSHTLRKRAARRRRMIQELVRREKVGESLTAVERQELQAARRLRRESYDRLIHPNCRERHYMRAVARGRDVKPGIVEAVGALTRWLRSRWVKA
jgi:hypothetical protein